MILDLFLPDILITKKWLNSESITVNFISIYLKIRSYINDRYKTVSVNQLIYHF